MRKISNKLNVQLIAELLLALGIDHIVLSPGSRNGALTMQFANDKRFKTYSVIDERSAGFVALGMAQQIQKPVVVCCTSGSATANYYPAITEAFFQNIPIIVLSADRPENLVDNFDGQTIRQQNLFEKHSVHNVQLSESEETDDLTRNMLLTKYALMDCINKSAPIHINMPFSEPLYEFVTTPAIEIDNLTVDEKEYQEFDVIDFMKRWNSSTRKMVLVGLHYPNEEFNQFISKLAEDDSVVILTEVTSNIHHPRFFNKIDQVIFPYSEEELESLKPEILLTIGQNVVSKKIKKFLRDHQPTQHWHLDEYWQPDTFQVLTDKIETKPEIFLEQFLPFVNPKESDYYTKWNTIREANHIKHKEYVNMIPFSDLKVFNSIIKNYPDNWQIQYGNSTVIRYALLFDHTVKNPVFCNRGTSGIDGSTSTAIGACIASKQDTLVVTGDISFLYDSNALWNVNMPKNFRIILINNGGGNIFKFIPGPSDTDVVEEYFVTQHHHTAEHLAKMFDFEYQVVSNLSDLEDSYSHFYAESDRPKILEIDTRNAANDSILRSYFSSLK
ncbi:2-succinyl-5-enolpyruvyl-6-hydroxy-3-cyclohexene-1-carboxylate synthase [Chishuiella changwenlii]|uniref:2-succinyl-5-enolpyruvyl-6-hydroxy-3-cyclohexene-1-carboxylate synthase n=1 Tax=Chishuiella changwenlii TaxID=1434701 RepID=A0A1M6XIV1_9FLAO|nr:2-succinyl-5-enolpyruvyl-6-hydroxy-3-cyclohexene-1-carboxylic-acid synthase [Chishuiella changwenlii]GGF00924.1 2-succinyl-5-enolpyruvyl-6-hydroxy-3-cyclohexene-1-carboxylate synthase [Chishuiella changwenlii]SHL05735.1 2-succinyl-5-enolpyruvyl-6-hydroxy-3-cyclohexene-1-carboxylate synthase [Chishuiella changwenlii]